MIQKKSLEGTVVKAPTMRDEERMYSLLTQYFEGYERNNFAADLANKDGVVLLRDDEGEVQGFTTFQMLKATVQGQAVRGVFSGDTIVDKAYWGQTELAGVWSRHMLGVAQESNDSLYWFLICSGYKTYRFLPTFFKEYYPRHDAPTPELDQQILDTFAQQKFGAAYDKERGLVTFTHSSERLKPGVADVTEQKLVNPHIRFFNERNPEHLSGIELACLTRVSKENYHARALRMIGYID